MSNNVLNNARELKIDELEIVSAAGTRKSGGSSATGQTFLAFKFVDPAVSAVLRRLL